MDRAIEQFLLGRYPPGKKLLRDDYGWGASAKAGRVERYLDARNVSRREFAPRLMLRCLRHPQQEVSPAAPDDAAQRGHILHRLHEASAALASGPRWS